MSGVRVARSAGSRRPVVAQPWRTAGFVRLLVHALPRVLGTAATVLCGLAVPSAAWSQDASCGEALGEGVRRVSAGALTLAWAARPQPIPLDRHFQLDLMLCGATAEAVRVDADMPAHRHGMNYRASLSQTGPGRYRAEGLLFHMPGRWRLIVDVDEGGRRQRLTDEILLR